MLNFLKFLRQSLLIDPESVIFISSPFLSRILGISDNNRERLLHEGYSFHIEDKCILHPDPHPLWIHPFFLAELHPLRHLSLYPDHHPGVDLFRHLLAYLSPPFIKFDEFVKSGKPSKMSC